MLIVIDCQPVYKAVEKIIDNVIEEVKRARKRGEWIMLLEYEGSGRTAYRITKHLKSYHKVVRVVKRHDDGSSVVFERLYGYHWRKANGLHVHHLENISHLRVVGVNTSSCVAKTVKGLTKFVKVTVLNRCCANGISYGGFSPEQMHKAMMNTMSKWKNVIVK